MEKFLRYDVLPKHMEGVFKENISTQDSGRDECCSIAENMIEEIHQIASPERRNMSFANGRLTCALKKKLLRQIRAARKMVMI